jgi:hypothetical protein
VLSMEGVRPGVGDIEGVGVLPGAGQPSAAAGASVQGTGDPNAYRLYMRMAGGGSQSVDVDHAHFMAGERVQITEDGRVLRISGTTLGSLGR